MSLATFTTKTMSLHRSAVVLDRSNTRKREVVEKSDPQLRTKPAAVEDDRTPVSVPVRAGGPMPHFSL